MQHRPGERSDEGQVTAFVVVMIAALMLLAGLVFDGGQVLAAKRRAGALADASARAGAGMVSESRLRQSGELELDSAAAETEARGYLSDTGAVVRYVIVKDDTVQVGVSLTQPLSFLQISGRQNAVVEGDGRARLAHGVSEEE